MAQWYSVCISNFIDFHFSTPKAKPRLRNNSTLINSTSQPVNNAPPIPPKTKCSSMTCIDEQIGPARHDDTFNISPAIERDSLASDMQQISIKRSAMISKTRPLLCPPGKTSLQSADSRADFPIQPVAPLRNSSTRKVTVNSMILPPGYDEEFSDIPKDALKVNRDISFYHQDPVPPVIAPVPSNQTVTSYPMQDPHIPVPIQSYKFKREQSLPSSTLPRSRNNAPSTACINKNCVENSLSGHYEPIVPAIPPKSKRAVSISLAPVAKPRRIKADVDRQHNLNQKVSSPHLATTVPCNHIPSSFPNDDNIAYPSFDQLHYPVALPKKHSTNFISPMVPPRMKSNPPYPVRN